MPTNLLFNGGFENEFHLYANKDGLHLADGWSPWWVDQIKNVDPAWKNRRPEYKRAVQLIDPSRIRSGDSAQQYFTFWGTHIGGLFQRVMVPPNARLRFSVWGHAWSSEQNVPRPSVNPTNVHMKIGIDPTGGIDPHSASVVWSAEQNAIDEFKLFIVEATAQGGRVTVFIYSAPDEPKKHQDLYWDDAELIVLGPDPNAARAPHPEITLAVNPSPTAIGSPVTVTARSAQPLVFIEMRAFKPDSALLPREPLGNRREGSTYVWEWRFTPEAAGQYPVAVLAKDIAAAWATVSVGDQPSPPPSPPPPPPPPPLPTTRGAPRTQYARTYLLLPNIPATPEGNAELARWYAAVVRSGVLETRRWTVGTSADDAGIGDLNVRRIIAVKPASWPSSLSAFYQQYYPGIDYHALNVNTPEELEAALRALNLP
jgi:hypothetical protein